MPLSFDFFFSFRSPYSYLAIHKVEALRRVWDVEANLRPVLPIAVRIPGFFETVNPLWPPYLAKDCRRIAEMAGQPYRWPRPDPIVQDRETRKVAADQPYIHRLTRLGAAAAEAGRGFAYAAAVARMMWSGEIDGWHEGDHLALCAGQAGLDHDALEAAVAGDPAHFDALLAANAQAQTAAGHWGVPLFAFEGEPFFGQDRLDALIWRMTQKGLQPRRQ
jgi:2-hydroxychromene-2-carboxylate isomerase